MIFNAKIKRLWPRDPLQVYNKAPACVVSYRLTFLRYTSPLALAGATPHQSHPSLLHRAGHHRPCRPLVGATLPRCTVPDLVTPCRPLTGASLPRLVVSCAPPPPLMCIALWLLFASPVSCPRTSHPTDVKSLLFNLCNAGLHIRRAYAQPPV
jgi:hypothetical protein